MHALQGGVVSIIQVAVRDPTAGRMEGDPSEGLLSRIFLLLFLFFLGFFFGGGS